MNGPRHRHTILVIDDEPDNLMVVVRHLEAYSFEVLTARDGEAGLSRARLTRPDVILLDVAMPGIDGYETCRRLKADPDTAGIPVLFLTALSEPDDKVRGFTAGGVDYVTKPIEGAELLARVQAHVQIRTFQADLERRVAERTAALERELQAREAYCREREHLVELLRWQSEQLRQLTQQWLAGQRDREQHLALSLQEWVSERLRPLEQHLEQAQHLLSSTAPEQRPVAAILGHLATARELVSPALEGAPTLGGRLSQEAKAPRLDHNPLLRLSTREYEVLQLLAEGKQTKQIASALGVASSTVSTYRARILDKLEIEDTASLLKLAFSTEAAPWNLPG